MHPGCADADVFFLKIRLCGKICEYCCLWSIDAQWLGDSFFGEGTRALFSYSVYLHSDSISDGFQLGPLLSASQSPVSCFVNCFHSCRARFSLLGLANMCFPPVAAQQCVPHIEILEVAIVHRVGVEDAVKRAASQG